MLPRELRRCTMSAGLILNPVTGVIIHCKALWVVSHTIKALYKNQLLLLLYCHWLCTAIAPFWFSLSCHYALLALSWRYSAYNLINLQDWSCTLTEEETVYWFISISVQVLFIFSPIYVSEKCGAMSCHCWVLIICHVGAKRPLQPRKGYKCRDEIGDEHIFKLKIQKGTGSYLLSRWPWIALLYFFYQTT